jgi:uncharacterized membrane protein YidH (DUF202 family)
VTDLFDAGLQPERTELAWRRTALALGVGSLIALRMLPAALGNPWWTLAGAAGLLTAALLWVAARRRYVATTTILLRHGDRAELPGAAVLLMLVGVVTTAGTTGLAVVLTR